MRINDSSLSLFLHRWYSINSDAVAKSMQRLASGYRINSAADDAAGLCISEKMRAQIAGLNMAAKNSQDAISLVQTAEGALGEAQSILQRMNELAVQAATGTLEGLDRSAAAKEFEQLKRELNDISAQTNFNNMSLLDGSLSYSGYQRSAATAGVNVTKSTMLSSEAGGVSFASSAATDSKGASLSGVVSDIHYGDTIRINGKAYEVVEKGGAPSSQDAVAVEWDGKSTASFVSELKSQFVASDENLSDYVFEEGKTPGSFTIRQATANDSTPAPTGSYTASKQGGAASNVQTTVEFDFSKLADGDRLQFRVGNTNVDITKTANMTRTQFFKELDRQLAGESNVTVKSGAIVAKGVEVSGVNEGFTSGLDSSGTNALRIQVGALENQQLSINIDAINTAALGLDGITLDDQDAAGRAITAVRNALNRVSDQRTTLGAMQNRLEYKISNLKNTSINLAEAESRIRDVDMAAEMTNLVKHQILVQTCMAMMAQCNSRYQNILTLFGSL